MRRLSIGAILFIFIGLAPGTSSPQAIRGRAGDQWADVVIGKRSFGEFAAREIVPYKVNNPGGVIVDRSVTPGRAYVWDSGNNRLLGIDLAAAYPGPRPYPADLVIGQSSGSDRGAPNRDGSFQFFPDPTPAGADRLAGVKEHTHTTLEDKSFANMAVDPNGNVYVPDINNHRVLLFLDPFHTDAVADDVWGQDDFAGNRPNKTGNAYLNQIPPPDAGTLAFHWVGGGVALDALGELWIADGSNNRVLHFPSGSKTADLVLGQPGFSTSTAGSGLHQMDGPLALRFDPSGKLYVADSNNQRVLVFQPPFFSGMPASSVISLPNRPYGLEVDATRGGIFVSYHEGWENMVRLYSFSGSPMAQFSVPSHGGGSIGVDAYGHLLVTSYIYGQDVHVFGERMPGQFVHLRSLFSPPYTDPYGYNEISDRRLEHLMHGVTVTPQQLVVSDGRLLFWNDPSSLVSGAPASGYLGAQSFEEIPNPRYGQVKRDAALRIWVTRMDHVEVYESPLAIGASPIATITSPVAALGGGQLAFSDVQGIAPSEDGQYLWISDSSNNRVFRIRDPLTSPLVDVVLGQVSLTGTAPNRGIVPPPNQNPGRPPWQDADLTMLARPGLIALDRFGNLFVSDHYLEHEGNWRLLMFSAGTFPPEPGQILFAPSATKEFPRWNAAHGNPQGHSTFEAAFATDNTMVVGRNPYDGGRFVDVYFDPLAVTAGNPRDPHAAVPDNQLLDFGNWLDAMAFDDDGNLWVHDYNRGQVRKYLRPLNLLGNSGFEQGFSSWRINPFVPAYPERARLPQISITHATYHTPKRSLRILATGARTPAVEQSVTAYAGEDYEIGGFIATYGLGTGPEQGAWMVIRWRGKGGTLIREDVVSVTRGTTPWTQVGTVLTAPQTAPGEATIEAQIAVYVGGESDRRGRAFFDDLSIRPAWVASPLAEERGREPGDLEVGDSPKVRENPASGRKPQRDRRK